MACGCQGTKAQAKSMFVYTGKDGSQVTFPSKVQAQAAVIKNGGGSWVAVPR